MKRISLAALCLSLSACGGDEHADWMEFDATTASVSSSINNNHPVRGELGSSATFTPEGRVRLDGDFATSFGQNGRTCAHCHDYRAGWSVNVSGLRKRFEASDGLDPIFRSNDGANAPNADLSTPSARLAAFSMLLSRGVIRVGLPVPANAEFELIAVDDPYGYASARELSLFRRPLPSANLRFIPAVMWDGRVSGSTLEDALSAQADGATLGHAEALAPLPADKRTAIVNFELALTNAAIIDDAAGRLDKGGSLAGPEALQSFAVVAGRMSLFDGWSTLKPRQNGAGAAASEGAARLAVVRGQALFNDKRSRSGGTCQGCHSVANVGTSAQARFFDIGVSAAGRRTADLPLYTFRNIKTGELRATTDPGRALVTGLWSDMDRFKAPSLRGLAARAPYFHNGMAPTLEEVVRLYQEGLGFEFTPEEQADLVAFLRAL